MPVYNVDLYRYFFDEGRDGLQCRTLNEIRNISKPTPFYFPSSTEYSNEPILVDKNILFVNGKRGEFLRSRLLTLLRVVSENSNIEELYVDGEFFHIPGEIIAKWLVELNKYVTRFYIFFGNEQSGMSALCNALQQDKTIETIGFDNAYAGLIDLDMFGKSLQKNKTIINIDFYARTPNLTVLKHALGPGSNIKSIEFEGMDNFEREWEKDLAKQIEYILSNNISLNSFKIESFSHRTNMTHILRGVSNNNSTITEFRFTTNPQRRIAKYDTVQNQRIDMKLITKMKALQKFEFNLHYFSKISSKNICSTLEQMKNLNFLHIDCSACKAEQVKGIIQKISKWEGRQQKCKLHIDYLEPDIEVVSILHSVYLVKFQCYNFNQNVFNIILQEIPKWKYIKHLSLLFKQSVSNNLVQESNGIQLLNSISKNSSVQTTYINSLLQTPNGGGLQGQQFLCNRVHSMIEEVLFRNVRLNECKNNPEQVPVNEWPELFVKADITGLDFSYECIRKIPHVLFFR